MTSNLLTATIDTQIAFQQKWKRVMSEAYFSASALGILLGAAATIVAALNQPLWGPVLAGSATAVYGIEKALLLRETWAHHLSSEMEIRSLKINYGTGTVDDAAAAKKMGEILQGYAVRLPIAPTRTE